MAKIDYYLHENRVKSIKDSIKQDPSISEKNKELIMNFENQLLLENISKPRIYKYLYTLRHINRMLKKDFNTLTKIDIEKFVAEINSLNRSEWTKQGHKVILKRFMKWVRGTKKGYPKEVDWIKTRIAKNLIKLPNEGDLLTEEEIKKMLDCTKHFRDRALISVLWESGARIGEIGTIQIKDIIFDKYGALVNVIGKTGSRSIRLISSVPYLAQWLSTHPSKDDRNSYVWVTIATNNSSKMVCYALIRKLLKQIAINAGIKKRVNPHSFRHARATFLANHMTEFQMNQYFGWIQGSDMPSTYIHMTGKNTEETLLRINGIITEKEEKPSVLQPKNCSRCSTINVTNNKFCSKCGAVLDIKTAIELQEEQKVQEESRQQSDNYINAILKDPEIISIFVKKVKEIEMLKTANTLC